MMRNIIFILLSIGLFVWCGYIFKKRKNFSPRTKAVAIGLFVLWLLTTFIPNIPVFFSPFTPSIKGKVIDADTNQPIANCNIKAFWEEYSIALVGGRGEAYSDYFTITNSQGEFTIPSRMKIFSWYALHPVLTSRFNGMTIVAFDYKHKFVRSVYDNDNIASKINISMYKNDDPSAFLENIFELYIDILSKKNYQSALTVQDKQYLSNSYTELITVFGNLDNSKLKRGELDYLSILNERHGNITTAISIQAKRRDVCKDESAKANVEILRLKRKLR